MCGYTGGDTVGDGALKQIAKLPIDTFFCLDLGCMKKYIFQKLNILRNWVKTSLIDATIQRGRKKNNVN